MFWRRKLKANLTKLIQYADAVQNQRHRLTNDPRKPQRKARVNERMRRGAVVSKVQNVEDHKKLRQPNLVAYQHFPLDLDCKNIIGGKGHGRHCRFCLAIDHNMDPSRLRSTGLARIREANH